MDSDLECLCCIVTVIPAVTTLNVYCRLATNWVKQSVCLLLQFLLGFC